MKEVVSHLQDFVHGNLEPSERKVFMYSAHDTTVAVFLSALKIFNNIQPPYCALVMVELHQAPDTSEYYVQVRIFLLISDFGMILSLMILDIDIIQECY